MADILTRNDRFYLNRRLIVVVAIFLLTASGLVVLTNFSINMIAASRDYTALISRWTQYHYRAGIAAERYGRTGATLAYREYTEFRRKQKQLREPVDELFDPDTDSKLIFNALRSANVYPNEISTLIMAFNRFSTVETIQLIKGAWRDLVAIEGRQQSIVRQLKREWEAKEPNRSRIGRLLSDLNRQGR